MMTLSITTINIAIIRCDTQHNDRNASIRITIKNVAVSMTKKCVPQHNNKNAAVSITIKKCFTQHNNKNMSICIAIKMDQSA